MTYYSTQNGIQSPGNFSISHTRHPNIIQYVSNYALGAGSNNMGHVPDNASVYSVSNVIVGHESNNSFDLYNNVTGDTLNDYDLTNDIAISENTSYTTTINSNRPPATHTRVIRGTYNPPRALVYSGVATKRNSDCAIPIYNLLKSRGYNVHYCGSGLDSNGNKFANTGDETTILSNGERIQLTLDNLQNISLYVQPGGGDDIDAAWKDVSSYTTIIQQYLNSGGKYLGTCMGAFLAGGSSTNDDPGYSLLTPDDTDDYTNIANSNNIGSNGKGDILLNINWTLSTGNKIKKPIYFQGGPYFTTTQSSSAKIIATYDGASLSQQNAALVLNYGKGKVAVCGPHPEAPKEWYTDGGFSIYDNTDLFFDLIKYLN